MKKLFFVALILCAVSFAQTNVARMLSGVNSQTGTSYTFVASDVTKIVTFNNANPIGATLPAGSTTGFGAGSVFTAVDLGVGTVTITCSGCTINGAASIQVAQNSSVSIYGDGANYVLASGGGGGGSTISGSTSLGTQVGGNGSGGFSSQTKLIVDARDKGIDCSGSSDMGPTLTTLTDNIIGAAAAMNGNALVFPAGCVINLAHTWTIRNLSGFTIAGPASAGAVGNVGNNVPTFKWTGSAGGTMINMDHVDGFDFRFLNLNGNLLAGVGIVVDETTCAGCVTTNDGIFSRVRVSDADQGGTAQAGFVGISLSPVSASDVGDMRIVDSTFYCHGTSAASASIMMGNTFNVKNITIRHNNLSGGCAYGVWKKGGNFTLSENEFGNNQVASVRIDNGTDTDRIVFNNEESDPQFLQSGSSYTIPLVMIGNHFAPGGSLNAGVYHIDVGNSSNVIFEGNSFDANGSMSLVMGSSVGGGAGPHYVIGANAWPNTTWVPSWITPSGGNLAHSAWSVSGERNNAYLDNLSLNLQDTTGLSDNMPSPALNLTGRTGNFAHTSSYGFQAVPNGGTNTFANSTLALTQQGFGTGWFSNNLNFTGLKFSQATAPVLAGVTTRGAAGGTSYTYAVVAHDAAGTVASSTSTIATGNATLNGTNFNVVAFFSSPGAAYYDIYRTASGGAPASTGKIGTVLLPLPSASGTTQPDNVTFSDTGLAGDSAALPTINTTGKIITAASTTGAAGLNLPHGSAPTTPINGDVWTTTAGLFAQINGGTVGPMGSGGGGGLSGMTTLGMPIATSPTNIATSTVPGTNQGTYVFGRFNSVQGVATSPIEIQAGDCSAPGVISGATTTYTIIYTDVINCNVTHDIAATQSATITIPPPATLNNPAPVFVYSNYSTHTDTLTPSTYQISMGAAAAGASLSVPTGVSCKVELDYVNGTTYKADCHPMSASTPTVTFSGSTTTAVSAGAGVNSAAIGTALIADGSGNAIPRAAVTTVGLGGVWSNGMPLGIQVPVTGTSTLVNGTMYVQQVNLTAEQTIGNATFNMTTCAACAEVINACMYNSAGTTLLWSGISSTINGTGAFSATGTQATLTKGVYYLSYSASGGGASVMASYSGTNATTDAILNKNGVREGTAANGISGGACPATLGVLTGTNTTPAKVTFALEP